MMDVNGFLLDGILIMYGATSLVPIHIVFFFGSFWILQIVGNVKTHVSHYTHNTLWAPQ